MKENTQPLSEPREEASKLSVIVHSFFIVPFLIAVFAVLIFLGIRILTHEPKTVYDYIEDVKIGSLSKRWQSAFELSRILANKDLIPKNEHFSRELIAAFEASEHDDVRVRQYLALAMGRTEESAFIAPLLGALNKDSENTWPSIIYALGMLKAREAVGKLMELSVYPEARIRLVSVMALGNIGDPASQETLCNALHDSEPNVAWDAAIALAKMGKSDGSETLIRLMDRTYFDGFPEVDSYERNEAMIVAIEAAGRLNDPKVLDAILRVSREDENMKVKQTALRVLKNLNTI